MSPSLRQSARLGLVALALAFACADDEDPRPPIQQVSGHVAVAADERFEVCAGTAAHYDAWLESAASWMGVELPAGGEMTYYWLADQGEVEDYCPPQTNCVREQDDGSFALYTSAGYQAHELTHVMHDMTLPLRPSLVEEGLAVMLDDQVELGFPTWSGASSLEELVEDWSIADYGDAMHFVSTTIDRHGVDKFREFWLALPAREVSTEEFRASFEQVFGESFDAQLAATAEVQACSLRQCVGTPVAWDDDGVWRTSTPSCDDPRAVGRVVPGTDAEAEIRSFDLLDIETLDIYELRLSPANATVVISRCGFSCAPFYYGVGEGQASATAEYSLPPGRYRIMTLNDTPSAPTQVEIRPAP